MLPGLGVDLANPAADAGRETAWLASLGATRDDKRHGAESLAPRASDPFLVARFVDAAQGDTPDTQPRGGAIDPEAASAQLGHASGTMHDEPLIEWRDVKHAALSGPFGAAPRDVQDVLTGPLVALLRKPETIHFLVDPTGGDPIKGGLADVIADLANDPAFTTGFAEGALTGTVRAVYDTIKGFYDAGKLIQEILVKLATFQHRALLAQGKKVIDDLMGAIKDAPGALEEFAKQWRAADSYTRGQFQGEVLGYILTQIAIIIAGSITGGPAMAGPFANVIKVLGWVDNPIAGLAELAAEAKLSTTALEALRAGQGIRSIEPIAEARAASGVFDGLAHDAAATRRPMATADELAREPTTAASASKTADNEITAAAHIAAERARIAQAIGDVPISAAPSTKGRPSYFITRADGAELQRLIALLPEARVTEFPRGLTIHRDGSDWFLEWMPEQGAPAHALAAARNGGSVGLPPSNASLVQFHGFRGLQTVDGVYWKKLPPDRRIQVDRWFKEDPLLHFGHVGVSFDGGRTIYGLTPSRAGMTADELMKKVINHEPMPAVVLDDTQTFIRAQKLAAQEGWDLALLSHATAARRRRTPR